MNRYGKQMILACAAVLACAAAPLRGAEYYVATNGVDTADGTSWATALATIGAGIAKAASAGDTVWVSNGTYQITATIAINNGITVKSLNGAAVTTVDAGNRDGVGCFRLLHADAVLEGFTLTRGKVTAANTSGGVYMTGGTVRWCRIINNYGNNDGGSVHMDGGVMTHCVIQDGQYGLYHGTIRLDNSAILRNCLVTDNYYRRSGGVYMYNTSRVENCTIVRNRANDAVASLFGGGIIRSGGTVVNTIIYFNTDASSGVNYNVAGGSAGFTYSCSTPLLPGLGNSASDPLLVDIDNRDYRLLPGSPVIGAGTTNLAWLAANPNEVDLDGAPRVVNGLIDLGAYQYTPGALDCGFVADTAQGLAPLTVQFASFVAGTNTGGMTYYWDLTGDGAIDATDDHPEYSYVHGTYAVTLTVSNAAGEEAVHTRLSYIQVGPPVCFVSTNSAPAFPYDTWETAAATLQPALDAAVDGTLIRVGDGNYTRTAVLNIEKGVTLRSENGVNVTALYLNGGDGVRALYLSHPDAVVDGFTVARLPTAALGGGVQIHYFGTVQNCAILNGKHNHGYGANLTMNGGAARNCLISGGEDRRIGGVRLYGGALLENGVIVGNRANVSSGATPATAVGGVSVEAGCTLRNSLVTGNAGLLGSSGAAFAGGAILLGGLIENCTIVGNSVTNSDAAAAGGLRVDGGTVRNTIIRLNHNLADGSEDNWHRISGVITYSCTTPSAAAHGTGNIDGLPAFVDAASGDYRLTSTSPGVNAGINQLWMEAAVDLAGLPRRVGRNVDMGAYECQSLSGTMILVR